MDKKQGGRMIKRNAIFFILSIFLVLTFGCNTIKEAFKGTATGVAAGTKKDWEAAKKADQWMRDNLW
jgi:hypothetical protein